MKKFQKHRLMPLIGSLGTLALPIIMTVSCSSSWTKWNPDQGQERPTTEFDHSRTTNDLLWKVRSEPELRLAWDEENTIIDLDLLNNQYELITLLGIILNFNSDEQIDEYWNQPLKMKEYVSQLTPAINNLKLVFKEAEDTIGNLDLIDQISKISQSIDNFVSGENLQKAFDVELKGLNSAGLPVDQFGVALAGFSLMSIDIVSALVNVEDSNFALKLSKLVNLPIDAFKGFEEIMLEINAFWEDIFNANSFNAWHQDKNINFEIQSNGFYYPKKAKDPLDHVRGQFLVLTLKK